MSNRSPGARTGVRRAGRAVALLLGLGVAAACGAPADDGEQLRQQSPEGRIQIDGSSTVYLISEAVAEEFQIANPAVQVTVAFSGSGGGFSRFCQDELDLANASREIDAAEAAVCRENGVDYTRFVVGWDGISVVVNPGIDFVDCLTLDELRRIWQPRSSVRTWRDVRPEWPPREIDLYGPGTASGTFDYFTDVVVGQIGASRADYQPSEDDNVLVQGVAGDADALGYFGYAYYRENQDRLRLVAVDSGNGCIAPSDQSIEDGSYGELARPLYVYATRRAVQRPEVMEYLTFLLNNARELVRSTGYYALPSGDYAALLSQLQAFASGADA